MGRTLIALATALALLLAACGGSDDGDANTGGSDAPAVETTQGDDQPTETTQETAPSNDNPSTPEVTEMGSFTVNGTEFAVTFLNRCIPFSGPDSDQIDLQPIAQGQGAELNLYGTADSLEVSVQGSTVTEIGGSIAFAADEFGDDGTIHESVIDGDRWSGSATLADSLGSGSTVDVTWDVMIPADMRDCSL